MAGGMGSRSRKKRKTVNPLSDARSGKDESRVEALWFRKCGLAPKLFIDYYAFQPLGVVVGKGPSEAAEDESTTENPSLVPPGQSRASKRRRKKKQRQQITTPSAAPPHSTTLSHKDTDRAPTTTDNPTTKNSILVRACLQHYNASHLRPFVRALAEPLPITFRIRQSASSSQAASIKQVLQNYNDIIDPMSFGNIYQGRSSQVSKASINTVYPQLRQLLLDASTDGTIARQDLGSVLPVLALSAGNWLCRKHRVLDMCASPGNKLLQALEIIGGKGRITANDVNPSRLQTLKEAVARSGMSNIDRVRYANLDASRFPLPKPEKFFDAIVCDVPCSGDGTIRKDSSILSHWKPSIANELHSIQLRILVRAIQLLKVGGVVSYSTCSLNPVENEAVVAAALSMFSDNRDGSNKEPPVAELLQFPYVDGFIGRPGVSSWKVADFKNEKSIVENDDDDSGSLRWLPSFKATQESSDSDNGLPSTLWPPSPASSRGSNLHLDRCIRLWPQDHNAGGFFVALIRKKRNCAGDGRG